MKVFITGIAGFLGAHVARESLAKGWDVTGIDNMLGGSASNVPEGVLWRQFDARSSSTYSNMLRGTDVVYHCAAAPYEGLSVFSPQLVFEHTLMSTIGIVKEAINAGVKRFVLCSSMSRYGHQGTPFHEGMVPQPADPYAHSKVAAENTLKCLADLHGMEWSIAVPHNIYGPLQRYWDPFRNVAAIMVNRVLSGKPPIVYGDGSQRRCLSYIEDVTGPLLRLATDEVAAGQVFNVGPDDEGCTILELATTILELCGSDMEPVFFPARPAEVHTAHCAADKARELLGYTPVWKLDEGLSQLIDWVASVGPRPFDYHLPIEIKSDKTPKTWSDRLM